MATASLPGSSEAAAALENDDLVSEILLRLPPQPSSLPRASRVCSRWRRLLSDPAFRRRFRIHHRRGTPPLLGLFGTSRGVVPFQPALDFPDRLPSGHFSLVLNDPFTTLGWRHGLALFYLPDSLQVLVWNPLAGAQHRVDIPEGFVFDPSDDPVNGAVLRAAGDVDHFKVVLVTSDGKRPSLACVYSSETGLWGDFISAPLQSGTMVHWGEPSVLARGCIYWLISVTSILEFDLDSQTLAVILVPAGMRTGRIYQSTVMRAEGGGMGYLNVADFTAELWRRETDCDGSWMLGGTVELDKLLPPGSDNEALRMLGYAEENNEVFFWTVVGVFMFNLQSLQLTRLSEIDISGYGYHPFETVYTPGIGGGQEGPEAVVVVKRRSWWKRWGQHIRGLFSCARGGNDGDNT
ncbi:uncharacterized protein LOC119320818 [Triticum dicoccoides]|uniref:uncharacterized protein LOC119320818 n=1 Tax=Triticum dicoccoides TaxID=85692 RepID=UPI001891DE21|nr:uncharacterized protein LOC119320818 [Triticum dicoccoides]